MGSGDLAGTTPVLCTTPAEIEAAVDALNLAAVTDKLVVVPFGTANQFYVFKVEREA